MTKPSLFVIGALLATLVLGTVACKKQPAQQVQAGGEILPGSASDAMLPLDTVTSQPPLAPRIEKAPSTGKARAAAAGDPVAEQAPGPAAPDTPPG